MFGDQKWGDLGGLHSNKSRPELTVSRLTARNAIRVATRIVMFLVWPRPELSCVVTRNKTLSGYCNYMKPDSVYQSVVVAISYIKHCPCQNYVTKKEFLIATKSFCFLCTSYTYIWKQSMIHPECLILKVWKVGKKLLDYCSLFGKKESWWSELDKVI